MSQWAHVAAIVRVDAFRENEDECYNFEEIFGKELKYEDPKEKWDYAYSHLDKFLPFGSEGSLTMTVWTNPELNELAAYTVSIFGDLRDYDYDDLNSIIYWFKDKCSTIKFCRNACIVVTNGYSATYSWHLRGALEE